MNRNITLILLTLIVLILLGIWLYLVFSPDDTSDPGLIDGSGDFTQFDDLTGDNDQGITGDFDPNTTATGTDVVYDPDILRQLTTRNVIGYEEITLASSTYIIFMESGVGHIYGIDLSTGIEERLSATTIPNARMADFSNDGELVVIKTGAHTGTNPIQIATVDYETGTVNAESLAEMVDSFLITDENTVLYSVSQNSSVEVKRYDPINQTTNIVFDTPFREASLLLNKQEAGPHYFYPKSNRQLEGFVYRVNNGGGLNRLPLDGFGFTAQAWDEMVMGTSRDRSALISTMYKSGTTEELTEALLPQKCVAGGDVLYCATPNNTKLDANSIDDWNRGTITFADNLTQIIDNQPQQLISITGHTGRNVDVINGTIENISGDWYFQNKMDNTLWIYELSRLTDLNKDQS